MSKAILIIDMPESCKDCGIRFTDEYSDYCPCKSTANDVFDYVQENKKPSWCPLKSLPSVDEYAFGDWDEGYRACLEDILGD
jgi:hypothetical protein